MADSMVAIKQVLEEEGFYSDDPDDSGGETKYGISKKAYPSLDIKNLTLDDAVNIYQRDYWQYNDIHSQSIANKLFSFTVNMGPHNAHRLIQRALVQFNISLRIDGILGPVTTRAINSQDFTRLLTQLKYEGANYYYGLVSNNKKYRKFLFGWLNRAYK